VTVDQLIEKLTSLNIDHQEMVVELEVYGVRVDAESIHVSTTFGRVTLVGT